MKIGKEYSMLFIAGLYILGYLLDLVVEPLNLNLSSPYAFFQAEQLSAFPFSTTSILIKAVAMFLTPLWLFSFFSSKGFAKPIFLLVLAGLIQLYAAQDIITNSKLLPLEWTLSMTAAGFALFMPTAYYFIKALLSSARDNLTNVKMQEALKQAQLSAKEEESEN